jgi:Zn-dependent peptidase ImmA (M78 family)/transcriptional regulator with XRE-family HTH domain
VTALSEQVNPRILAWARETAGLSIDEAANKLGLTDSARGTASEKLRAIESGEKIPTQSQLSRAASLYRRPLITFYLAQPPRRGERGEDFRTHVSAASATARENGLLDSLLRDIRARQQILRSTLEESDEAHRLPFVASARISDGTVHVASSIRAALAISENEQRRARSSDTLFGVLRAAAGRIGIYVLLAGDVGSYHSDVDEGVFRGFAIADEISPFIVINDNDARAAWSFTLLHELAHIWIGASGVSGSLEDVCENEIESFCNDVAGLFLLPPAALDDLSHLINADVKEILWEAERIAEVWNVSQAVVTYRFLRNGWIRSSTAHDAFGILAARWRREKKHRRDTRDSEGGPSYYVVKRHRLGTALLDAVRRGLQGDVLTHTRAAKILGVSPLSVQALLQDRTRIA